MKRPTKSFVVERKRKPRGANAEPASIWSDAVGRELRTLVRTSTEPETRTTQTDAGAIEPSGAAARGPAPKRRILEVRAPDAAIEEVVVPPRRRGRPKKQSVEIEAEPIVVDVPVAAQTPPPEIEPFPATPSLSAAPAVKPSYRERRLAARKALPVGERWKWNLASRNASRRKR